jgi:hypothetical protein
VQRDHLLIQVVGVALLAATGAAGADEVYRLVSDARYARAGADGSVFVLAGKREPTPGAWIQDCEGLADSLTRVDGKTGVVLWSTCLPFRAENVAVDASGAVTIAGAVTGARATPGAFSSPGGDEIAVVRLNPAGTAADWIATVAGNLSYPYAGATTWTAIGPDGSVYGAATVTTENLPVTDGALRGERPSYFSAYFFRLSADGSKLLYATYINDGNECFASDLAVDGAGNVFVGGACDSFWLDGRPSMATPGSFTTARDMWVASAWVARFDPATSAFRYVCVFEQLAELRVALASAGRGRVAISGMGLHGVLTPTAGAFFADRGAQAGDRESFVVVLNPEGSAAEVVASYGLGSVRALESDANGNLIVAGERSIVATTANAWRIVGGADDDTGFVLKLSADGSQVVYATGIGCRSCAMQSVTQAGNTLWIAEADGSGKLTFAAAQPVTLERPENSVLRAVPDNWAETVAFDGVTLSWDTREPAVRSAEIRLGAADGPLVARGTTGAIALNPETATYYFLDTTSGRRVLGVETFTRYTPLSGIPVDRGYGLTLNPNPVLSCREAPLTGTQTRISGYLNSSDLMQVRVGAPDGPVVTAGWGPTLDTTTRDWVRNGLTFFLVRAADNQVYGSVRAYLLPNRSCTSDAPLEPMILATRDCVQKDRFTLAWYAGTAPVEIRDGDAAGPKAGLFTSNVGLFDVTATTVKTYWLMSWQDGGWKPIASTVADPGAACGQGVVP